MGLQRQVNIHTMFQLYAIQIIAYYTCWKWFRAHRYHYPHGAYCDGHSHVTDPRNG